MCEISLVKEEIRLNSLEKLEKRLLSYKEKYSSTKRKRGKDPQTSVFVITELVAGIAVGGFLGYHLDQYFNTKILFMFILVILGLVSSLYNIYNKCK